MSWVSCFYIKIALVSLILFKCHLNKSFPHHNYIKFITIHLIWFGRNHFSIKIIYQNYIKNTCVPLTPLWCCFDITLCPLIIDTFDGNKNIRESMRNFQKCLTRTKSKFESVFQWAILYQKRGFQSKDLMVWLDYSLVFYVSFNSILSFCIKDILQSFSKVPRNRLRFVI